MRPDKSEDSFPSEEELSYFWLYRHRIDMEDHLTNHRVTWLIITQSLLIALWVGARKEMGPWLGVLTFMVAIAWAALIFAGLCAAQREIRRLNEQYSTNYPRGVRHPKLPLLIGDTLGHGLGKFAPYGVPFLFAIVWICLLWRSLQ